MPGRTLTSAALASSQIPAGGFAHRNRASAAPGVYQPTRFQWRRRYCHRQPLAGMARSGGHANYAVGVTFADARPTSAMQPVAFARCSNDAKHMVPRLRASRFRFLGFLSTRETDGALGRFLARVSMHLSPSTDYENGFRACLPVRATLKVVTVRCLTHYAFPTSRLSIAQVPRSIESPDAGAGYHAHLAIADMQEKPVW